LRGDALAVERIQTNAQEQTTMITPQPSEKPNRGAQRFVTVLLSFDLNAEAHQKSLSTKAYSAWPRGVSCQQAALGVALRFT
jgi:hypothetical protein